MSVAAPVALDHLLAASDSIVREAAWDELIAKHTRLLLAVARSFGGGRDDAMERYSYILEKLFESDFRRLRTFDAESGASFSTWLTVTTRRLCLDHHRNLYGRQRPTRKEKLDPLRALRRRIMDSVSSGVDADSLSDSAIVPGDTKAVIDERDAALRGELIRLAPRDRLLLALRFEDDLSASQISRILGLPTPFNVYRRLNVVLGRLRAALEARGIDSLNG
ncbi:MAG: RNA polymerase sigma factor [Gemmatimonadaceae bacterium]